MDQIPRPSRSAVEGVLADTLVIVLAAHRILSRKGRGIRFLDEVRSGSGWGLRASGCNIRSPRQESSGGVRSSSGTINCCRTGR